MKYIIKRAIQRIVRGWDDRYWWSHRDIHAKITAEALDVMIKECHGYPHDLTMREWKKILREMRDGFRAVGEMDSLVNFTKVHDHRLKIKRGLDLYAKHYLDLWD